MPSLEGSSKLNRESHLKLSDVYARDCPEVPGRFPFLRILAELSFVLTVWASVSALMVWLSSSNDKDNYQSAASVAVRVFFSFLFRSVNVY